MITSAAGRIIDKIGMACLPPNTDLAEMYPQGLVSFVFVRTEYFGL
jgi:hypothetical protein